MPLLFPLVGLLAGILIGDLFSLPAWGIIPLSAACVIYLIILKKSAKPTEIFRLKGWHKSWVLLLFFGIGGLDMSFNKPAEISFEELENYVLAEGEIRESKPFASGDRVIVRVSRLVDSLSRVRQCNDFRVVISTTGLSASVGDIVSFPARFQPIADNPNFRPSGYKERMNRNGIFYKAYVNGDAISVTGFNNSLFNQALRWRDGIVTRLEKSSLSRPACDFISALLLGDRSFLSSETRASFSNAGVAHVLALSGLHITIFMGIILALFFPLEMLGLHVARYLLALLLLWGFVFVTGLTPSTIRAAIMTTFVVAALLLQRRNSSGNALLAAVFLILLIDPRSIFDVGLQLSVLCVGSILCFAGPLNPVNRRAHPFLYSLIAALLVSLIATAATWVVIAYYFNSIPLLFLPVNFCLLPLLPIYVWIGALYILLLCCGWDLSCLSAILNSGYTCFDWIVTWLSAFGKATVSAEILMPVMILWLSGILVLAYTMREKTPRKKILIAGGICCLTLSVVFIPLLNRRPSDSIIFQKNYSEISIALYEGNVVNVFSMPRNSVSRIFHKGAEILSIDTQLDVDSLTDLLLTNRKNSRNKYMILGSGFKGSELKEIPFIYEYDKIILHSSLKRKMENKLRQEAFEMGIISLYSLREEGALEEFLPASLPDNM